MGEQPVGRLLLSFSLPALVAMVVQATYNIVDTAFVGRLGHEAIAALTLVWPAQLVMMALSIGVGVGANSLIARRLGAGDEREANCAGAQAFLLALLSALVMMVVLLGRTDPILRAIGARPETLPFARVYLRTIVWFAPLVFFPMVANNLIRAEGNPLRSMVVMIVSALTNIVLDPLFIFGAGPVPAMGVRGAAIATVIASGVAFVLYAAYFAGPRSGYHFRPQDFLPRPRLWNRIYSVGLPSMAIQLSGSVVATVANGIIAGFGTVPLAAYGVAFRLLSFAFMPCIGISQGVLPLAGYNFGAGRLNRVREVVLKGTLAACAITTGFSLLFIAFPGLFVALFNREPAFLRLAAHGLRIAALAFAPVGATVVFTAFFQAIGRALPAMFLSLARQFIFYLPALLLLARLFGENGFWFAIPVSDLLATAASIAWTAVTFHRLGIPLLAPLPSPRR
jgi:putative MATE family efflux protein